MPIMSGQTFEPYAIVLDGPILLPDPEETRGGITLTLELGSGLGFSRSPNDGSRLGLYLSEHGNRLFEVEGVEGLRSTSEPTAG